VSTLRVDTDADGFPFASLGGVSKRLRSADGIPELRGASALAVESAIRRPEFVSGFAQMRSIQQARAYGRALFDLLSDALGLAAVAAWSRSARPILEVGGSAQVTALAWELLLPIGEDAVWFCLDGDVLRLSGAGAGRRSPLQTSESDDVVLVTARPYLDQDVALDAVARSLSVVAPYLRWLPFANRARLSELTVRRPRFLHLDLHGLVIPPRAGSTLEGPTSVFLLNGEHGPDRISPVDLLDALRKVHPRFLVATSCQSSLLSRGDDQSVIDLASAASDSWIECVIAARRNLTPTDAAQFTERFYGAIADGESIVGALRAGRRYIAEMGGSAGIFAAASFTLTWVGDPGAMEQSLLTKSDPSVRAADWEAQAPAVPLDVFSQIERGGGILSIQADDTEAQSYLKALEFWGPKLLPPVPIVEAVSDDDLVEALAALSVQTDEVIRVHDWTAILDATDFLSEPNNLVYVEPQRGGVDVVLVQGSPRWVSARVSGTPVVEVPARPRMQYPDFDDVLPDGEPGSTPLSRRAIGRWLLRRGSASLDIEASDWEHLSVASGDQAACQLPEPLFEIATGLPTDGVLAALSSFSTGILLPRIMPSEGAANTRAWGAAIALAQRALLTGHARAIEGPRARLVVFDCSLAAAIIDALWSAAPNIHLPLNSWAEAELAAAAPGFRYGHPDPAPDYGVLRDRLRDVAHMSGEEALYRAVAARNRVMYCLLHRLQRLRPPPSWPGFSSWFSSDDISIVEAVESSCSAMPERSDDEMPRPSGPVAVRLVHGVLVIEEGEQDEAELESLPEWAKHVNEFQIDLTALTPVQHAMLVLGQGPDRGMTVYQPLEMWRTAMMADLLTVSREERETELRRTARELGEEKWPEDQVHLLLEASKIAAELVPHAAVQLMLETLAEAMSDGSTHSTGHALEVLLRLADFDAAKGDLEARRRRLRLASRLALSRDWNRYRSQLRSVIAALRVVDIEESLRLFDETRSTSGDTSGALLEARLLLASGDLGRAKTRLDALHDVALTLDERTELSTAELELSAAAGEPQVVVDRTGGPGATPSEDLTGMQLSLRGDALAALGMIEEARSSWLLGSTSRGGGGKCAISLATSLLTSAEFARLAAADLDHTRYSFPSYARVAYLKGLAHLAVDAESASGADLLRVGLWSAAADDLVRAAQVLHGPSRDRLAELEDEFSYRAGSWLVGEAGASTPIPQLDVETYETVRLLQFRETVERLVQAEEDLEGLWENCLREHTRRVESLANLLWDQQQLFRARRHFLSLIEVLETPRLASLAPARRRKVSSMFAVAVLARALGEYHEAIRWAEATLAAIAAGDDSGVVQLSFNLIGNSYHDLGEYKLAAEYQWRSLGPLAEAESLHELIAALARTAATEYQTVLSLFNYGNSLVQLEHPEVPLARFAAALAFYKLPNPETVLVIGNRQDVINSLGASFVPQPAAADSDPIGVKVIRYLHQYANSEPS
jgi:tetratricopeptide (TPR) repeat protein